MVRSPLLPTRLPALVVCARLPTEQGLSCSWAVKQQRICRVDVRYPAHVSPDARDFMGKVRNMTQARLIALMYQLLRLTPADRMSLENVPRHDWIQHFHVG